MPGRILPRVLSRVPGVRRLPVFKLLAIAEIAMLARKHYTRLDPAERARLIELVRRGRGTTSRLTPEEREELTALTAKLEPRQFAGLAIDKISPVPLPRRFTRGPRRD